MRSKTLLCKAAWKTLPRRDERKTALNLQLWLIRHGETEWSLSGAHTSRTDIPLTARGEERAARIRDYLNHRKFSLVLTSPLQRARETCRVAGYADVAQDRRKPA